MLTLNAWIKDVHLNLILLWPNAQNIKDKTVTPPNSLSATGIKAILHSTTGAYYANVEMLELAKKMV